MRALLRKGGVEEAEIAANAEYIRRTGVREVEANVVYAVAIKRGGGASE